MVVVPWIGTVGYLNVPTVDGRYLGQLPCLAPNGPVPVQARSTDGYTEPVGTVVELWRLADQVRARGLIDPAVLSGQHYTLAAMLRRYGHAPCGMDVQNGYLVSIMVGADYRPAWPNTGIEADITGHR